MKNDNSSYPTIIKFFIREEPYGFLSNFERTGFTIKSWDYWYFYPTNEHYYQAQKANCKYIHDYIVAAPHARIAMVLGRQLEHNKYLKKYMKEDWENQKLKVMLEGLTCKFETPELRKMLLDTGHAILHEDNPEDFYWGIADGTGVSALGLLLMRVRSDIRYDSSPTTKTEENNGE